MQLCMQHPNQIADSNQEPFCCEARILIIVPPLLLCCLMHIQKKCDLICIFSNFWNQQGQDAPKGVFSYAHILKKMKRGQQKLHMDDGAFSGLPPVVCKKGLGLHCRQAVFLLLQCWHSAVIEAVCGLALFC